MRKVLLIVFVAHIIAAMLRETSEERSYARGRSRAQAQIDEYVRRNSVDTKARVSQHP